MAPSAVRFQCDLRPTAKDSKLFFRIKGVRIRFYLILFKKSPARNPERLPPPKRLDPRQEAKRKTQPGEITAGLGTWPYGDS